jgi:hypothetical protein
MSIVGLIIKLFSVPLENSSLFDTSETEDIEINFWGTLLS